MKKFIACIFLLLPLAARPQASVYHPFPSGNANWVYRYYDDFHNPTTQFTSYAFNGDTLISGFTYKKVFTFSVYSGALRESNKIIYFIPDTSSSEFVLYDFSLGLGDTLPNPYGGAVCSNDTAIVIQVDSVLASDGYHRQLLFNSFAIWIEGIGSYNYLLNPCNVYCVSGNDFLQCMAAAPGISFPPGSGSCVVQVPESSIVKKPISIFPNPFSDHLHFMTGTHSCLEVSLYDAVNGKIIHRTFTNEISLPVSQLPGGIYFYEIKGEDDFFRSGKVVKN